MAPVSLISTCEEETSAICNHPGSIEEIPWPEHDKGAPGEDGAWMGSRASVPWMGDASEPVSCAGTCLGRPNLRPITVIGGL